jgi:hypothetical protein
MPKKQEPVIYDTLRKLVAAESRALETGDVRPYRVIQNEVERFVVSVSPGQASIAVCKTRAVSQKEITQALLANTSEASEAAK